METTCKQKKEDCGSCREILPRGGGGTPFYNVSLVASVEAQLCNRCILDMVDERYTNKQQNGRCVS